MTKTINDKIVQVKIKKDGPVETSVDKMNETIQRPSRLDGATYKIKPPEHISSSALYITINNTVLNEGTDHEVVVPFEMFINSKNMEHFQWIVALTRIASGVFRKGGDLSFLVEELKSVFDPNGGYWTKTSDGKAKFVPSLVAEIGNVIEQHLSSLSQDYPIQSYDKSKVSTGSDNMTLCKKCNTVSVILMDGCPTCTSCGDSKCG